MQSRATAALALGVALLSLVAATGAQTLSVLYTFTGKDGDNGLGALVRDSAGNLYGTSFDGGDNGAGTVVKLSKEQNGVWKETVLYTFQGSGDGAFPLGRLVLDSEGNLYGITSGLAGTLFKLTPSGEKTELYTFCSLANCADGASPNGGLVRDADGNLYGTTALGGLAGECCGTAFKVTKVGKETVLYNFCSLANCADGSFPVGGGEFFPDERLVRDAAGNLYGTTPNGGVSAFCKDDRGCGTVFEVDKTGKETVLYSFCSEAKCADGLYPTVGLTEDAAGNLYGTTLVGGAHVHYGTVFEVNAAGKETVLYSFPGKVDIGEVQPSSLAIDAAGNLYGTTEASGKFNAGSVFRLTNAGGLGTLYSFHDGTDGGGPMGGLILDPAGNLYGTTGLGGDPSGCNGIGCGTAFELTP
jgi:uncharacterized repeat protein (TIGR03803 family)